MPNGQYRDADSINAIARNVAAVPEVDQPFPELVGHVFDVTAYHWLEPEHLDSLSDGLHGAFGSIRVFGCKEPVQTLYVA
jgi:hypothetical protein